MFPPCSMPSFPTIYSLSWRLCGSPPLARAPHRPDGARHRPGDTVMGRMVQHAWPTGVQRLRAEGGHAPKTLATVTMVSQVARAQGEGLGKGAVKRLSARLPSRPR